MFKYHSSELIKTIHHATKNIYIPHHTFKLANSAFNNGIYGIDYRLYGQFNTKWCRYAIESIQYVSFFFILHDIDFSDTQIKWNNVIHIFFEKNHVSQYCFICTTTKVSCLWMNKKSFLFIANGCILLRVSRWRDYNMIRTSVPCVTNTSAFS